MAQNVTIAGNSYPDVPAVSIPKTGGGLATFYDASGIDYAGSPTSGGNANVANAILYGKVDSTSTSTVFTATVAGLTQLVDGTCIMLHNGVVTSAANFTVNVNNLGAKKCYNNMTNATQDTTIFNIAYTMMFVYASDLDEGNGGFWIYRGYDGNTNTIGYQVRTNSGNKTASDTGYRYRLWFTSADGSKWVPANTSTSTNATSNRSLNTRAIDPFGPIVYRATNGTCTSGTGIGATGIWQQYTLAIGYSYMASGFSLTAQDSVYLKCTPNADGSATMNSIVQALPSSKDGKIYIHLGTAYSATNMELEIFHPVYWHDGTGIRAWTGTEYQAALVSGTNIKTINNESILGSGDITVSGSSAGAWCGHSNTAQNTMDKVVICSGFTLEVGAIVSVYFYYASAWPQRSALTLNVNGTGAVTVSVLGEATDPVHNLFWQANDMLTFAYDGTYWAYIGTTVADFKSSGKVNRGSLPIASSSYLGAVKAGSGLSVAADGTLSATAELPSVTSSDNGKVLQVVNGAWAAASLPSASGVMF